MLLDTRQQIERLQAVDSQLFEKIVVGRKMLARHLEMFRRESEDFVRGVMECAHQFVFCHKSCGKQRIRPYGK
jgi:hypothetical protein